MMPAIHHEDVEQDARLKAEQKQGQFEEKVSYKQKKKKKHMRMLQLSSWSVSCFSKISKCAQKIR